MAEIQKKKSILNIVRGICIVLLAIFHMILLFVLDFNIFSDISYYDYKDSSIYILSCYGIAISLIGILGIGIIKGIWMCHSMAYVRNMIFPFVVSLLVEELYYRTNWYLQRDIIDYTALICLALSFTLLLIFLIVGLINHRVEKEYQIGRKIYRDFVIVGLVLLVIVLLGGFTALNYVRGKAELLILITMVHMSPALVVLEAWGVVMYLIYRIKKSA